MKVVHILNFVFILLALIGVCVIEEIVVSGSLTAIQNSCFEIEEMIHDRDDVRDMDGVLAVDNLEYDWNKDESKLCFMENHKNIQEIGQEISKIKLYIADNDVAGIRVSLSTIRMYCHGYMHFMGANLHNVL